MAPLIQLNIEQIHRTDDNFCPKEIIVSLDRVHRHSPFDSHPSNKHRVSVRDHFSKSIQSINYSIDTRETSVEIGEFRTSISCGIISSADATASRIIFVASSPSIWSNTLTREEVASSVLSLINY